MDADTRAWVATILGNLSAGITRFADEHKLDAVDWQANVTVEKPWCTIILSDGTRVRITAEVENVSDPIATLQGDQQ